MKELMNDELMELNGGFIIFLTEPLAATPWLSLPFGIGNSIPIGSGVELAANAALNAINH